MKTLFLSFLLCGGALSAATVYSNPASGDVETAFFSVGPFTEIGDQIALAGAEREVSKATVMLFNVGAEGTFDAILRFYATGAPVGAQLATFALSSQLAPSMTDFTLEFPVFAFTAPDNLVFTLEIVNAASGVDLGLDLFPAAQLAGYSDPSFLLVKSGSFSQQSGFTSANAFFTLEAGASQVPEPGTFLLAGGALLALIWQRRS